MILISSPRDSPKQDPCLISWDPCDDIQLRPILSENKKPEARNWQDMHTTQINEDMTLPDFFSIIRVNFLRQT